MPAKSASTADSCIRSIRSIVHKAHGAEVRATLAVQRRDSEAVIPERDVRPPNCGRLFESHHSSSVHPRISTDHRPALRLHLLCFGIGSEKKSLSRRFAHAALGAWSAVSIISTRVAPSVGVGSGAVFADGFQLHPRDSDVLPCLPCALWFTRSTPTKRISCWSFPRRFVSP